MKQSYRPIEEFSPKAKAVGEKIVHLLLGEGITYQEADDALSFAQVTLATETGPTIRADAMWQIARQIAEEPKFVNAITARIANELADARTP